MNIVVVLENSDQAQARMCPTKWYGPSRHFNIKEQKKRSFLITFELAEIKRLLCLKHIIFIFQKKNDYKHPFH